MRRNVLLLAMAGLIAGCATFISSTEAQAHHHGWHGGCGSHRGWYRHSWAYGNPAGYTPYSGYVAPAYYGNYGGTWLDRMFNGGSSYPMPLYSGYHY